MSHWNNELIALTRDCEVVEIPSGFLGVLPTGAQVRITQSLGGAYTVITDGGAMVRIAAKDADALGMQDVTAAAPVVDEGPVDAPAIEARVWEQLRMVYDPEIPVNVVELGLVYECLVGEAPGNDGFSVTAKMTLTAPGCGMGPVLVREAEERIKSVKGVVDARVDLVLEPPWDPSRMSEAARLELGFF